MVKREFPKILAQLYERDETAWLEEMSRLVAERRFHELDAEHLGEYLSDMARRDNREVLSRLTTLLTHLLNWDHQANKRTNSWRATIANQRDELKDLLESGTLRNYANEVLEKAYGRAVKQSSLETDMSEETFPSVCPFSLDSALGSE
jgi:hypothetical protein